MLSCKLGMSATSSIDIVSVFKEIAYNDVDSTSPQTAANTVPPIGWFQGHKWVEGELRVMSEISEALYVNASGQKYINPGNRNDEMRYFTVWMDVAGGTATYYTFADPAMTQSGVASTVIWGGAKGGVNDYETSYFSYPFKAKFVMTSGVHAKT